MESKKYTIGISGKARLQASFKTRFEAKLYASVKFSNSLATVVVYEDDRPVSLNGFDPEGSDWSPEWVDLD